MSPTITRKRSQSNTMEHIPSEVDYRLAIQEIICPLKESQVSLQISFRYLHSHTLFTTLFNIILSPMPTF
jgi:hypothetical protein